MSPATSASKREIPVEALRLADAGAFPNNPQLAVLVYRGAFPASEDVARDIEATFRAHGWAGSWRDTVYDFDHYHSTAHEVLGCYAGEARLWLGGEPGRAVLLRRGDVIVLPAGTAHRKVSASADFAVVGAYAQGRSYDMLCGKPGERPESDRRIAEVPLPEQDPVYGGAGVLRAYWQAA